MNTQECFNLFCKSPAIVIAEAVCWPGSSFPMCWKHWPSNVDFVNVVWLESEK